MSILFCAVMKVVELKGVRPNYYLVRHTAVILPKNLLFYRYCHFYAAYLQRANLYINTKRRGRCSNLANVRLIAHAQPTYTDAF